MSLHNLSWKCALDMGKLSMCKTTTKMKYDPECVEFFSLFALMFGSSAVDVLRGPANFSQVITDKMRRGLYDPQQGTFNFAIPSVTTLKKVSSGYPKNIPVGLVEHSLCIAEEQAKEYGAQYVLCFDGKLVAAGCKGENEGDINLWGRERPSLTFIVKQLEMNERLCRDINMEVTTKSILKHYKFARQLLFSVSERLRALRERVSSIFYIKKRLIQTCSENPANQLKYMRRISLIHQNSSDCEAVLKLGLSTQKTVVELIANETGTHSFFLPDTSVDLSEQQNVFQLLPPEAMPRNLDLTSENCIQYIKQGSAMWHEQRKKARITGSTIHKALGLESLTSQKQHHAEFILGRKPRAFDDEVKKRLEHGLKNEKNVIATLVSYIMPVLLPPCFRYFEVGPMFIHIPGQRNFIEVSPDGVLKCGNDNCCEYRFLPEHKHIAIEVKSPYPDSESPDNVYYEVRPRNVLQIEAEMIALGTDELWLLCGGKQSVVAMKQVFDKTLWQELLKVASDLYKDDKPNVPTCLHASTRDLRHMLTNFAKNNSSLLCEVPALSGVYGDLTIDPDVESPYAVTRNFEEATVDYERVNSLTRLAATEGRTFFAQAHTPLRTQAHEVIVFMITEKDRLQQDKIPYAYPVGYALKGSSMGNADLRFLVEEVRRECRKRNIPLLCEVYDGQWQQFITTSSTGDHLTKFHGRNTWNRISTYTKDKVLSEMYDASAVKTWDLDLLRVSTKLQAGQQVSFGNITVWRNSNCTLETESLGGAKFDEPVLAKFVSVTESTRPDLFPLDSQETQSSVLGQIAEEHSYTRKTNGNEAAKDLTEEHFGDNNVNEMAENLNTQISAKDLPSLKQDARKKRKEKGLQPGERDLLCLLDRDMVESILGDTKYDDDVEDDEMDSLKLTNVLLDERCDLLYDIHAHLIYNDRKKWGEVNLDSIYPGLLMSGEDLMKKCTVAEIKTICGVMEHYTRRCWFSTGSLKAVNVNTIVRAFGGNRTVQEESVRKSTAVHCFEPERLSTLARDYMKRANYERIRLTVALGSVIIPYEHQRWLRKSPLLLNVPVPGMDETVELFSYPERDSDTGDLLFRTFDYTHILTNMRSHILSRGYDYCTKEAFKHIIDNSKILSRYMVEYKMDIQNAFSAEKLFSVTVEQYMWENGFTDSATFIRLVHLWHEACDKRGVAADERVRRLCKMFKFLTAGINFTSVPFQYKGRYIRGMTWQTFEAILQNISTRIQLYSFAKGGTYNSRAVLTLANESFFSDLVQLEKEGKGYPKACNVGRVLGQVVLLNHYKHNCAKNYSIGATKKRKYPVHLAVESTDMIGKETAEHHTGIYRNNFFDFPDQHKSYRVRKRDISTGLQSLKSVTSL